MQIKTMSGPATRQGSLKRKRTEDGRWEKRCGCLQHDTFSAQIEGTCTMLNCEKNSNREPYRKLVENDLLSHWSKGGKWLCSKCFAYSKDHFVKKCRVSGGEIRDNVLMNQETDNEETADSEFEMEQENNSQANTADESTSNQIQDDSLTEQLDIILNNLKTIPKSWTILTAEQQQKVTEIAHEVGSIIERDLYHDSIKVTKESSSMILSDINKEQWLEERNKALIGFITGCTGSSGKNSDEKKTNSLIHVVEQVLNTRNLTAVCPFAFQRNLVQFSVTGSKLATNLLGAWEPSGAYTKIQTFLNAPAEPPKIPEYDVHIAIDNEQRVGKTSGRIREGSNIRVDICTTMSCVQTAEKTYIQQKEDLKPATWYKRESEDIERVLEEVEAEEQNAMQIYRQYRHNFIKDMIEEVKNELDEHQKDHVDVAIVQKERGNDSYVCCKCKFITTDTGSCPNCQHDPNRYPIDYDIYHRSVSKHPEQPSKIMIGDPYMVNPNTKSNVKQVMGHVQRHCGTTGENKSREWAYLWCDAIPYLLGSKVLEETLKCNICGDMVTENEKETHQERHEEKVEFQLWFGDLFFRPGPGHIELNMSRALLKCLWIPFFKFFAIILGFRSPRAQQVIFNGVDHHRSRQILTTFLFALSKELIRVFVVDQLGKGEEPTVQRYFDWFANEVQDSNYVFAWYACFRYLLAFHMYTESVRKNHHEHMLAARTAFAPLFYGRNHPKYREVHLRDMMDRAQCPEELKTDIKAKESFSLSASNKGQGCDFLHEEVNRSVKSFLPPGVVTAATWTRVCRKADALQEMKRTCIESSGVHSVSGKKAPKKHDHEQTMFRREIRDAKLLDSPFETGKELRSITGVELDEDLKNIKHTLDDSYKQYKNDLMKTKKFGSKKLKQTLYITKAEREYAEAIENKTINEIKTTIRELISDSGLQNYEASLKSKKVKADYIKLYYEVLEAAQDAEVSRLTEELENED